MIERRTRVRTRRGKEKGGLFLRGERIFLSVRSLSVSLFVCPFRGGCGKSSGARNANANARCIQVTAG